MENKNYKDMPKEELISLTENRYTEYFNAVKDRMGLETQLRTLEGPEKENDGIGDR